MARAPATIPTITSPNAAVITMRRIVHLPSLDFCALRRAGSGRGFGRPRQGRFDDSLDALALPVTSSTPPPSQAMSTQEVGDTWRRCAQALRHPPAGG